jgi:rhodanese-related sulfurtransferase
MGLVRRVSYAEAHDMIHGGARWLDVRMPEEAQGRRLPHSLCIPYPVARARLFTADPDVSYVCVCASGRESPVIAFTLCKYDIDAVYLDGGFARVPPEALVRE